MNRDPLLTLKDIAFLLAMTLAVSALVLWEKVGSVGG